MKSNPEPIKPIEHPISRRQAFRNIASLGIVGATSAWLADKASASPRPRPESDSLEDNVSCTCECNVDDCNCRCDCTAECTCDCGGCAANCSCVCACPTNGGVLQSDGHDTSAVDPQNAASSSLASIDLSTEYTQGAKFNAKEDFKSQRNALGTATSTAAQSPEEVPTYLAQNGWVAVSGLQKKHVSKKRPRNAT